MRKKLFTLLLTSVLICSFSMPAMAATVYEDVMTSGGASGRRSVRFRCTCVQDARPTYYSWTSSITPPSTMTGKSYYQNGNIILENNARQSFVSREGTYSFGAANAFKGGNAYMSVSSTNYGSANTALSVTR